MPNEPISFEHSLREFQVPLVELERRAGVRFVPNLDSQHVPDLCQVDSCELMKKDKFELYFIGRRIEGANNIQQLQKAWNEISQKGLEPDDYLRKAYQQKLSQFNEVDGG